MGKKTKKKTKKAKRESENIKGLWYSSPLALGIKALVPVLLLALVGGLIFLPSEGKHRSVFMKVAEEVTSPLAHGELAREAALGDDYRLAEAEFEQMQRLSGNSRVLGWQSELEELIWPEKKIRRDIEKWEEQIEKRPSRDLYLKLAEGYWRLGEAEKSEQYVRKAQELDPNNDAVRDLF